MAKERKAAANGAVSTPRGMARVGSVANAPWWHLKNGNALYGKLLNVYERPDERAKSGKSKFFQVELCEYADPDSGEVHDHYFDQKLGTTRPTEVRIGRGKQAKLETVGPGTIINLNYGPKTKDFEPFVEQIMRGAEFKVLCIINGEKFEIKNAQTMWPIETFAEMTRAAKPLEEPDFDGGDDEDEAPAAAAGA